MATDEPTAAERSLYLTALANGGRLAPADLAHADPAALRRLLALGLLIRTAAGCTAVSPRSAGDRLGAELRTEATRLLVRAEGLPAALATLTDAYDAAQHPAAEGTRVVGRDAIRHRISLLLDDCRQELLAAQPGLRLASTLQLALRQELPLLKAGRRIRTVYQPAACHQPAVIDYAEAVTRHGSQIRVLDEPFDRMIIVDRAAAVVSVDPDHTAAAFITDRATVASLVAVFERDWGRATAVDWSGPGPHPTTARVGHLLVQGLTQRAVATRLGLSERTVAAHISRLRNRHGARNLFQLGWQMRGEGHG
ncbi:LuxR C-terminal-related transcriptional regulator [Kitasatospora sp. NBC_00458]|uniref:LuxR C-terminal-related transcriptional regulator n=1 Tax=Kitasatospora sp. NBC_00458 TaxID=2903568 RepID=UPI002E16CEE1